jgi:sulfide:quinone oxidoreductase
MSTQPVAPVKLAIKPAICRSKFRVVIAGGGIAALEAALALRDLAPDQADVTVIAPNSEFVQRPAAVGEPFARPPACRYELAPIMQHAGARLLADELAWVDPVKNMVHTLANEAVTYDALLLALGARARPRYKHAVTIDDRGLDETLHSLIGDVEGDYIHSLAFVIPHASAWPLPVYELALMTAARASDMDIELKVSIITPEEAPLAIFGTAASEAVAELLARSRIRTITSANAEVPRPGEVVIEPGDRCVQAERVIALPELHGPSVWGIPSDEDGFLPINSYCLVPDAGPVFAAGDATEFAVKHGGIAVQQAYTAASTIAALAGARVAPEPFHPVVRSMLLTAGKPMYLMVGIDAGHGSSWEATDAPTSSPATETAAGYLAAYLAAQDLLLDAARDAAVA